MDIFKNIQGGQNLKIKIRISGKHQIIKPFDVKPHYMIKGFKIPEQGRHLVFGKRIEGIGPGIINHCATDLHPVGPVPAPDFLGRKLGFDIENPETRPRKLSRFRCINRRVDRSYFPGRSGDGLSLQQ